MKLNLRLVLLLARLSCAVAAFVVEVPQYGHAHGSPLWTVIALLWVALLLGAYLEPRR